MSHPQNMLELHMLIELYFLADPPDIRKSGQHNQAAYRLIEAGVAEFKAGTENPNGGHLVITPKGQFYIRHICKIPYPEITHAYHIPESVA